MSKPNLFIVGSPKAGTTSLFYYLDQHPDIDMSDDKEPNFFCKDFHRESDSFHGEQFTFKYREKNQYLSLFDKGYTVLGEASTRYLYSSVAAKNIRDFNPDAKIIVMLREPVEFLHSYHYQELELLDETEDDFTQALALEAERKKGRFIPETCSVPSFLYYKKVASVAEQIQRYQRHFPSSQIKIILFDDFVDRTEEVFQDVLNFLGIEETTKIDFEEKNRSSTYRSKFLQKLIKNPNLDVKRYLRKILPRRIQEWLYAKMKALNRKEEDRESLDERTERNLRRFFQDEVEKLAKITGKEVVKKWDYD